MITETIVEAARVAVPSAQYFESRSIAETIGKSRNSSNDLSERTKTVCGYFFTCGEDQTG
jgi:hypothetical protein